MKKIVAVLAVALALAPVFAEELSPKVLADLKLNGGDVDIPGSQQGSIRFVNAQKRVPAAEIEKVVAPFAKRLRYDAKLVEGDAVDALTAARAVSNLGATLAIFVVDDPKLGTMLVAPEERWAIVNVAKLSAGNPAPAFLASRTRKEALRAIAFLTGGSHYGSPLMSGLKNVAALDDVSRERYPVDVTMRMHKYLSDLGVTRLETDTYRNALATGSDIAPTNEFQRAIYEQIKGKSK